MGNDRDIEIMDAAFLEWDGDDSLSDVEFNAILFCKFMSHNELGMRIDGIPKGLMDACYEKIKSEQG